MKNEATRIYFNMKINHLRNKIYQKVVVKNFFVIQILLEIGNFWQNREVNIEAKDFYIDNIHYRGLSVRISENWGKKEDLEEVFLNVILCWKT